jgi:hypothetical protein
MRNRGLPHLSLFSSRRDEETGLLMVPVESPRRGVGRSQLHLKTGHRSVMKQQKTDGAARSRSLDSWKEGTENCGVTFFAYGLAMPQVNTQPVTCLLRKAPPGGFRAAELEIFISFRSNQIRVDVHHRLLITPAPVGAGAGPRSIRRNRKLCSGQQPRRG